MKKSRISARILMVTGLFIICIYLCGKIGINGQEFWRVDLLTVDLAANVGPVNVFTV
jgi:hypothetical protein